MKKFMPLTLLYFFSIGLSAQDESYEFNSETLYNCDELIDFRDSELSKSYNNAYDKFSISEEAIQEITQLKEALEWRSSLPASEILAALGSIKAACDLAQDAYSIANPIPGKRVVSEIIYKGLEIGQDIYFITEQGTGAYIEREVAIKVLPLTEVGLAAADLHNTLNETLDNMEEVNHIQSEALILLKQLERNLMEYNMELTQLRIQVEGINEIKEGIDAYLYENCN